MAYTEDEIKNRFKFSLEEELINLSIYIESLELVEETGQRISSTAIKEMFDQYNQYYGTREYGVHCGSCINRVFRELKKLKVLIEKEISRRHD